MKKLPSLRCLEALAESTGGLGTPGTSHHRVWMVVALMQTGEVNLTRWVSHRPCRGCFAQSKQRRVRRWLRNARINVHRLYKPLIQAALADWQEDCLYLSLDTSLF